MLSSNPAQGWRIHYAGDGTTTLTPRDHQAQAYHLGLKLSAIGSTELQILDRPEQISADDYTVTYQWNDTVREWWVNSATGLEQWFELEQRPPDAKSGQPLTLEMTLATDLAASQQGNALSFVNAAGTTISYNKLQVWDADGRELPARMQLADNQLRLIIDDSEANYPLTIDPSLGQQAYLKASNTGERDLFGYTVAISGDTLVVGAHNEDSNATGINGDQSDNSVTTAGAAYVFVGPFTADGFTINAGLNDAWFNAATSGQGFLITVFPDIKQMFLAWFTYDTERPPEDVTALLGEPGHRWLTAQGPYNGDTANLTIFVTKGGVFDAVEPAAETDPAGDGSMTLEFADCTEGLVNYEIASLGISGEFPIQRIALDNVALCEALASP